MMNIIRISDLNSLGLLDHGFSFKAYAILSLMSGRGIDYYYLTINSNDRNRKCIEKEKHFAFFDYNSNSTLLTKCKQMKSC